MFVSVSYSLNICVCQLLTQCLCMSLTHSVFVSASYSLRFVQKSVTGTSLCAQVTVLIVYTKCTCGFMGTYTGAEYSKAGNQ